MVSSLSKKWSSVVRLLPLFNPKASDLLPITVQVIKDIEFRHIVKTIRNNWLNQKDYNCTYMFPNFEDISQSNYPMRLSQATFQVWIGI